VKLKAIAVPLLVLAAPAFAQRFAGRYAIILDEPPVAEAAADAKSVARTAASGAMARVAASQQRVAAALADRNARITGSSQILVNALYVETDPDTAAALETLPGVRAVSPLRAYRRTMDTALDLVQAPAAWNALGGPTRAGEGVKIGIIDSGIDHQHPAFQDPALQVPAGFPKCRPAECAFTNNKVIAARSYVEILAEPGNAEFTRPDDLSPRDRVGHGTAAAMAAAGVRVQGPAGTVSGVAPKAFLGNYKVFGSPGVNDVAFASAVVRALEDAVLDGMDIVTLSLGVPADWPPLMRCPNQDGSTYPCDRRADAVESFAVTTASRLGLAIVVAAGNDGDAGYNLPTLGSIQSPGTAPSAITVGATTNGHIHYQSLRVGGESVPSSLQRVNTRFGDGPRPAEPLQAPVVDVTTLQDDGKACRPLGNGTLVGKIALIERGDCDRALKVLHAQRAGAAAVVLMQFAGSNGVFPMPGLRDTGIPAVLIGRRDGDALRAFLRANPDRPITLDPALQAVRAPADEVAYFSSQGPSIGEMAIKPEIVAVGTDLYLATQTFDPNGDLHDPTGFVSTQGTSFAVPIVAGAAALVKQRNPGFTPAQIKSALVNTASRGLTDYDNNGRAVDARVTAVGGGKLNAAEAIKTTVTVDPATLSFGVFGNTNSRGLRVSNAGTQPVTLRVEVRPRGSDPGQITVTPANFNLAARTTTQIVARLTAQRPPSPGAYEGDLVITGGPVPLRVPYLYLVGDGVAHNIYPLRGGSSSGIPGLRRVLLVAKILDQYGVPVPNQTTRFRASQGGGTVTDGAEKTDEFGVTYAYVTLGETLGEQLFEVDANPLRLAFVASVRQRPLIRQDGVTNAAAGRESRGLAAGSLIAINGAGLADASRSAVTPYLPVSLMGVSVSFDAPERRVSEPGRIISVSPEQIIVQAPWELEGLPNVQMKVSIGDYSSQVYTVPLAQTSAGIFELDEAESGRRIAQAFDAERRPVATASPAGKGQEITLSCTGLGPVENRPASGEAPAAQQESPARVQPVVTIGGKTARVAGAMLDPRQIGRYVIRVVVPEDAGSGYQEVVVQSGESSAVSSIPVE